MAKRGTKVVHRSAKKGRFVTEVRDAHKSTTGRDTVQEPKKKNWGPGRAQ